MEQLILFIITFLAIYLIYYFMTIRKELIKIKYMKNPEKYKKKKKFINRDDKAPVEVQYLILKYKINIKDISYIKLLHTLAFVASFIMSIIVTIISLVSGLIWQLLIGFVLLIPMILVAFHIVGKIYQNKGGK